MPRPPVERIERQRFAQQRLGFCRAMELVQRDDFQVAGAEVIRVKAQRAVQMFHGSRPVVPGAINLRERVVASSRPGLIPRRLVKRSVGIVVATKLAQAQAEIVISLAVSRIGVATREPGDGLPKMFLGSDKFAAFVMPQTERIVAAGIQRIAPQRFTPVERGTPGGMAILIEVQAGDVKLVRTRDVARRERLSGGRRNFPLGAGLGLKGNDFLFGAIHDA